jgi:hypothetical protein
MVTLGVAAMGFIAGFFFPTGRPVEVAATVERSSSESH